MKRKISRMMEIGPEANMLTHRFPNMFTPLQHMKVLACIHSFAYQKPIRRAFEEQMPVCNRVHSVDTSSSTHLKGTPIACSASGQSILQEMHICSHEEIFSPLPFAQQQVSIPIWHLSTN